MALFYLPQRWQSTFDFVLHPSTWAIVVTPFAVMQGVGATALESAAEGAVSGAIAAVVVRFIVGLILGFKTPAAPAAAPAESALRFDAARFTSSSQPEVRFDASRFHAPRPQETRSPIVDLIVKNQVDIYSEDHAARFADALHGTNEVLLERDINHPDCPPDLRRFLQQVLDHYRRKRGAEPRNDVRSIEHKRGRQ